MAIVGDRVEHRTYKDGKATIINVDTLRSTYIVEWDHPKGLKREISFQEYTLHWKLITGDVETTKPKVVVVDSSSNTRCIHTWHKVTLFSFTVEECSKCGILRE